MRRFALKTLLAALTLNRAEKKHIDWDRTVLLFSSCVIIGLAKLYAFGKATSGWQVTRFAPDKSSSDRHPAPSPV